MTKAVVLLSGGIDSAVCMAMACDEHDEVIPVHFNYGQQTAELEQEMATQQCQHLSAVYPDTTVKKTPVIHYQGVFGHFAEGVAEPGKDFDHMEEHDGRSSGYVPMRNLHLIATGAAVADVRGAEHVYHGAQGGDAADYPDCRPEFMHKAAGAISKSVPEEQRMNLAVPLIHKSKVDVLQEGEQLGVNFGATYSCYSAIVDPEDPEPCGACPACVERAEAFEAAGVEDPYGTEVKV